MRELISPGMTLLALAGYGIVLYRLRRRGVHWPVTRVAAMLAGSLCAAAAVLPPIASHDELFPVHVAQHLLLGMAAPAFLALSAPVTLALRTLPCRPRRILLRLLHSFPVAVLAAPATAVVLDLGGLYALYLTGLYTSRRTQHSGPRRGARAHVPGRLPAQLGGHRPRSRPPPSGHLGEADRVDHCRRRARHTRQARLCAEPARRRRAHRQPPHRHSTDVLRRHHHRGGSRRRRDDPVVPGLRPGPRLDQAQVTERRTTAANRTTQPTAQLGSTAAQPTRPNRPRCAGRSQAASGTAGPRGRRPGSTA